MIPGSGSLHLVEHGGERTLDAQRLLHFIRGHIRIFSVFQKARPLVIAEELDHGCRVCLPVFGPTFQIYKYGRDAGRVEERYGVLKIFVEISIEDALVHEVQTRSYIEQNPAQIMK